MIDSFPIHQLFYLLIYSISIIQSQRSSLLHPEEPRVNSLAYLNSSSKELFQIINPISSCQFQSGPIPCECFPVIGEYGLVHNETTLLTFSVGPPSIQLFIPSSPISLLSPISVKILPKLCLEQEYQLQLWHRSLEVLSENENDPWSKVYEKTIKIKDKEMKMDFGCEIISRTGIYQISLIGPNNLTIMAKDHILVNSSSEVLLDLKKGSIFPQCSDEYTIRWTNPSCPNSLQFRLRLMAIPEGNPDHFEQRAIYVEEIGLDRGDTSVSLPCSQFDILYEQYCFELISIEPFNEQFHQWNVKCIYTEPVETIDGGWTTWSSWSSCDGDCERGWRQRTRSCQSPRPKRGKTCIGDIIQRQPCTLNHCSDQGSFLNDSNCTCGCEMNEERGTFFVKPPIGKPCLGNATWIFKGSPNQFIDLIILKNGQPSGKLLLYQDQPYKNLIWSSSSSSSLSEKSSKEIIISKKMDTHFYFIFVIDDKNSRVSNFEIENLESNHLTSGFTVVFQKRVEMLRLALGHEKCYPFCTHHLIIGGLSLILLSLIFIPPFICASITKRIHRNETPDLPLIDKRPESEMIRSGNTDLTQASLPKFVAKRSIGIQLSAHGTPRTGRASDTPLPFGSSTASVLDELEYDDYDGTRDPGSLLAPPLNQPYSSIDIEQIIAEARKIVDHIDMTDAHTQINRL